MEHPCVSGAAPHEYSWGTCKHCKRTWGATVEVTTPTKKPDPEHDENDDGRPVSWPD